MFKSSLFNPYFSARSALPERMDDPGCDRDLLYRTLDQFDGINRLLTGSRRLLARHVIRDMMCNPDRSYSFLDLGAGGGDIALWLYRQAQNRCLKVQITCLDNSPPVIAYLERKLKPYPDIRLVQMDAMALDPRTQRYDYVFSNHFLHHLPSAVIGTLVAHLCAVTDRVLLFNDLQRSKWSYVGYNLFSLLFLHRSFARYDGLLSIRKGFTSDEMRGYLKELQPRYPVQVRTTFPGRLYLLAEFSHQADLK